MSKISSSVERSKQARKIKSLFVMYEGNKEDIRVNGREIGEKVLLLVVIVELILHRNGLFYIIITY